MREDDPLAFDTPSSDGSGRPFVCRIQSPDGQWVVDLFGPNEHTDCMSGQAYCADGYRQGFFFAHPVRPEQITFRWDLLNGAWGVYVDGRCWALYACRPTSRTRQRRISGRAGPYLQPFTDDEIRFACAKRHYQKKGTRGGILEE